MEDQQTAEDALSSYQLRILYQEDFLRWLAKIYQYK